MKRLTGAVAVALGFLMTSVPASAQIWIGQVVGDMVARGQQQRCMSGEALPPQEIDEARLPAVTAMSDYWRRVAASDSADVRAGFHQHRRAQWTSGGAEHRYAALQTLSDPIGRQAGAAILPEPVSFVRAADGRSARGVWRVDNGGQPAGWYLADFRRRGSEWRIHWMEAFVAGSRPSDVSQYCNEPGDVERERVRLAEAQARRDARRAAREAERAAGRRR